MLEDYNENEYIIVIRNSEGEKYDIVTENMKQKVIEYLGSIKYSDITTVENDGYAYYLSLKSPDLALYIGLSSRDSIVINDIVYKIDEGYYPISELMEELQIIID